jgi:hypothetical protein
VQREEHTQSRFESPDYSLGADNRQVIATNICHSLLPRLQQKAH